MAALAEMHHDIMFLIPVRSSPKWPTLDVSCGLSNEYQKSGLLMTFYCSPSNCWVLNYGFVDNDSKTHNGPNKGVQ